MPSLVRRRRRASWRVVPVLTAAWVASACTEETSKLTIPAPDAAQFEMQVYPVLVRDCGFPECHGNPKRFFRVFGPGRTRLDTSTPLFNPPTAAELEQSYNRARSMLANVDGDLSDALLLRKPLDEEAGGGAHEGTDNWGRNVYTESTDPGYQTLLSWAATLYTPQASASPQAPVGGAAP